MRTPEQFADLYRDVAREVPDATLEEIRTAIAGDPDATVGELALCIWAARPESDPDYEAEEKAAVEARLAWRRSLTG